MSIEVNLSKIDINGKILNVEKQITEKLVSNVMAIGLIIYLIGNKMSRNMWVNRSVLQPTTYVAISRDREGNEKL